MLMYSAAKVPGLLLAIIVVAVSAVVSCPTTFVCVSVSEQSSFPLKEPGKRLLIYLYALHIQLVS